MLLSKEHLITVKDLQISYQLDKAAEYTIRR